MRRLAIGLVVLVVLAGCSTPSGGPQNQSSEDPTSATPTPALTTSSSLPSDFVSQHQDALRASGSYTLVSNSTFTLVSDNSSGLNTSVNITQRVDLEDEESYYAISPAWFNLSDLYATPEKSYIRYDNGTVVTNESDTSYNPIINLTSDLAKLETDANWSNDGTTEYRGIRVVEYTTNDPQAVYRVANETTPNNVSSANATVQIDRRGLIRYAEIRVTSGNEVIKTDTVLVRRLSEVGTTEVSKPNWAE